MRNRIVVVLVAVFVLLLLAIFLARNSKSQTHLIGSGRSKTDPTPAATPSTPKAEKAESSTEATPAKPDAAAAKRALGRCLAFMSIHRTDMWSRHLEAMHGGASPEYRRFARDFLGAAWDDLIPLVKSLLEECASDEAKFLLAAVLGKARKPEAVPLLKDLIAKGPGVQATAAALYSIGMTRTQEGLDYLTSWLNSARESKSNELGFLLIPALASIGRHGADSLDFMVAEARRRGDELFPSKADILAMVRGEDAVDGLRRILSGESDMYLRNGAAMALGSSSRPEDLEFLAKSDLSGALLAARNLPDVWEPTADIRRKLAERILSEKGVPEGIAERDWRYMNLAALLPPDKARPLYLSVTSMTDFGGDPQGRITAIILAFADQPDLDVHVARMGRDSGLSPRELQRAIENGVEMAALPGKNVGAGSLVERLLSVVKDPASQYWQVPLALRPVMRSGIPDSSLSSSLEEAWRSAPTGPKYTLLGAVIQGSSAFTPLRSLQFTQPERFLARVLKEEADPAIQLRAAYAYLVSGEPASLDPDALRSISVLVQRGDAGSTPAPEVNWTLPPLMGTWYARYGRKEDIAKLQALPDQFPYPTNWIGGYRDSLRAALTREMKRAIDAIRLSSN